MKKGRKKIFAGLIVILLISGWFISIFGIGNKVDNLGKQLKYGLDINGGVYVLLEAETDATGTELTQIMNQTKTVLENRVNAMGISEATVSIEGNKRIRVEMPGVENAEEAIEQIGRTAQLRFYLANGDLALTGDGIRDSQISTDPENGGYKIIIDFTTEGSDLFAEGTGKAASGTVEPTISDENGRTVHKTAIVIALDDEVISAPTVREKIASRSCDITTKGGFSQSEASSLSALIRGGALPANLTEVNSSVQTATVGANALTLSVKAGIIGVVLVFIILILAYGLLGVVANIALLIYIQIVLWTMVALGSVLSLPGIAGIILSVGMAVDSNVLIFTRIREEINKGKSVRVSVDTGYKAAMSTVIDSQTTTLIAAFVLYIFGTTAIKGFALTLMIGTVVSILTAFFITQIFISLIAESKTFSKNSFFGMNEDGSHKLRFHPNIKFMSHRKIFYTISAVIIVAGLIVGGIKGYNYGIDFTGGTMIQIEMGEKVDIDELKESIAKYELEPTIVYAGEGNTQVVIKTIKALKNEERSDVIQTITDKYKLDDSSVLASEQFGPTIGKDLKSNAIKSLIIASICMLIYIRFRFRGWKFGVAAIAGLLHDVLITLAMYAFFSIPINNPFIAGILTVVGYSINDTIVIFDRIRENMKFFKRKEKEMLLDSSINQILSRSLMTSVTTLIVIVPLYIMASSELRAFLIPLIIGIVAGTYSSVFLCSPIYFDITKKDDASRYDEHRAKSRKKRINDGIVR